MLAIIVLGLTGLVLILMVGLSISSHFGSPELGIGGGKLLPCPDTPNCVCSERGGPEDSRLDPLSIVGSPEEAWARARAAVEAVGGSITHEIPGYLRATTSSPILRFVDDLELRMDKEAGVIHVRAAARVGRSDLGANRKRVEQLRSEYETR
jgi:uncharacterized protein (DUF1499 family)